MHDHKGYSEERCVRCGWVMGHPPLNCQNDNSPHVFPSQLARSFYEGSVPISGASVDPPMIITFGSRSARTWEEAEIEARRQVAENRSRLNAGVLILPDEVSMTAPDDSGGARDAAD